MRTSKPRSGLQPVKKLGTSVKPHTRTIKFKSPTGGGSRQVTVKGSWRNLFKSK